MGSVLFRVTRVGMLPRPYVLERCVECRQNQKDQNRRGQKSENDRDDQRFKRLGLGRGFQQQGRHSHDRG